MLVITSSPDGHIDTHETEHWLLDNRLCNANVLAANRLSSLDCILDELRLGKNEDGRNSRPRRSSGLNRLEKLAAPGERFATNKHAVDSLASGPGRSYAYAAVSEHPVLLEGYRYRETALPGFTNLLREND